MPLRSMGHEQIMTQTIFETSETRLGAPTSSTKISLVFYADPEHVCSIRQWI